MVAAAVYVGTGKKNLEVIEKALNEQNNSIIPIMAPAYGLYLSKVLFPNKED